MDAKKAKRTNEVIAELKKAKAKLIIEYVTEQAKAVFGIGQGNVPVGVWQFYQDLISGQMTEEMEAFAISKGLAPAALINHSHITECPHCGDDIGFYQQRQVAVVDQYEFSGKVYGTFEKASGMPVLSAPLNETNKVFCISCEKEIEDIYKQRKVDKEAGRRRFQ
jgi:hypothetical protein